MNIRLENEKDYYEVENLIREAFWNVYRPGCFEHFIVHKLRNEKCFIKELDYVIEENNVIVANIIFAKGKLILENGEERETLLFGPVSVLPEYQKKGYGEKLIKYTMQKAKELGYTELFITGNQEYYKKFGFESASKYNIYYEWMNKSEESPFFMIYIFNNEVFNIKSAIYKDPNVFSVDNKELEKFDKVFPIKIKEKKEGQLES